jgi:hypothetical protein
MHDVAAAVERASEGADVGEVALDGCELAFVGARRARWFDKLTMTRTREGPHIVTGAQQFAKHVRSDEAAGAG